MWTMGAHPMQQAPRPTKTSKLVIVGGGETAELAYEYFTHDSPYEVSAFAVEAAHLNATQLRGLPVVALEELAECYAPAEYSAFVAISSVKLNRVRARLYGLTKGKGYRLASYVSSRAFVWPNVVIGDNCFILEHNVLQYFVVIGNDVVLWSGNHIGHRTRIGDHCFVASHVVISGFCEVGESCFLGVNSCVKDYVKIARDCVIGMGANIQRDTREREVYPGTRSTVAAASSFAVFKVHEAER
jgi:sugar O-acyltransferase (sialic acid O-acetyltransferase NeuD family)